MVKNPGTPSPGHGYRWLVVATCISALILGISGVIAASWIPSLPERVAAHWGANMKPDRFTSPQAAIWEMVILMGITVLIMATIGFVSSKNSAIIRIMVGTEIFLSLMGALLLLLTLSPQRGLTSAQGLPLPGWVLAVSLLVPAVAGGAAAAIVPRTPVPNAPAETNAGVGKTDLPEATTPWHGTTTMSTPLLCTLAAVAAAPFVWICIATRTWQWIIFAVVLIAIILLFSSFRIQIDAEGLEIKSPLGWPRFLLAPAQIREAKAVEVHPFRDFGGWGYRIAFRGGSTGIVLRKGPGVQVDYGTDQTMVFTVDQDAEGAVITLNRAAR